MIDDQARDLIRTALDRTLVVEAAAGTGKTTALVGRIVAVLAAGLARVEQIVAVTFTEKAAGELKLRLRTGLEDARRRAADDRRSREHLEAALARLEEAHVSTIHGFCADLLRERPVEAGVDPRFQVLTEVEAEHLYAEAFAAWLQQALEDPPDGVRRSLRRRSKPAWNEAPEGPTDRLRRAGWTLAEWRDFPAAWTREPFDRTAQIDGIVAAIQRLAEMSAHPTSPKESLYQATARVRWLSENIKVAESVRARDYDRLEAALVELVRDRDFPKPLRRSGGPYGGGVGRQDIAAAHAQLVLDLQGFARAADADLSALLHQELRGSIDQYERLKARAGKLDFVDLLVRARDLVRDRPAIREDFQRRFTRIFVDEFQDTDPLQAEILLLLASEDPGTTRWRDVRPAPGKLFLVGDPKQSIYRFRRADVGVYEEVKDLLVGRGADCVRLETSFRAVPSIQRLVNAAFAPRMTGDRQALQASYVPLAPSRTDSDAQPAVVVLPVPDPYGVRRIAQTAIEKSLPDATGAFVEWLVTKSGWSVTERDRLGARVDVAARHVCLLFRRFESFGHDITRPYVAALEARGIPHLLVGGKSFHAREEVETMRAALAAIEWPDDELAVFATLRGSLFAVGDEELLEYRHRTRRLHPYRIPPDLPEALAPIGDALQLLQSLHRNRNYRPVAETIGRLLQATRAHAGFALRPSGEQALANVLHIAELARQYEASGGISFRGFVDELQAEAAGGRAPEAPVLEEGSDGVRIMTVHKAKGLEFPVVILADLTAKLTPWQASRYLDAERGLCAVRLAGWSPRDLVAHEAEEIAREEAEGVRIAYVAATRARDLLVVPAVGDEPFDPGWIGPLNAAIYPAPAARREASKAKGCPSFGKDSVRRRPNEDPASPATVCPGRHEFSPTSHIPDPKSQYSVVWWDPRVLHLDAPPPFGLRQEDLLGKEVDRDLIEEDLRGYRAWHDRRDRAVNSGATPTLVVQTASERARLDAVARDRGEAPVSTSPEAGATQPSLFDEIEEAPASVKARATTEASLKARPTTAIEGVELIELAREELRPGGPRYGALVHAVLAAVPLEAGVELVADVARLEGRILGASGPEVESATRVVSATLAYPILDRARRAAARGECRRETPLAIREIDGTVVEGVVDLAFLEDGRWMVVDFKTDRELARAVEVYQRQVSLYARVIAEATGQPASACLMRV